MSYDYPAWCQMETALESYQQAREEFLESEANKLGPDGKRKLRDFNEVADSLIKGVQDLAGADGLGSLLQLGEAASVTTSKPFELLMEHVCITFGWEAMAILSIARGRFMHLLLLLRNRQLSATASAFLQRVAKCYLFGFDAECVIMCRAAMEREFDETVVDDDHVSDWWKWHITTEDGQKCKSQRPPYGKLWAKIEAAKYANIINVQQREDADAVRRDGNEGVHERPADGDALRIIEKTIRVLDALQEPKN